MKNSFIIAFAFVIATHSVSHTMDEPRKERSPEKPKFFTLQLTPEQVNSLNEKNASISLTAKQLKGLCALWFALQKDNPSKVVKHQSVSGMTLRLSSEQIQQAKGAQKITLGQEIVGLLLAHWVNFEEGQFECMPASSEGTERVTSPVPRMPSPLSSGSSGEQVFCPETPNDLMPRPDSSEDSSI